MNVVDRNLLLFIFIFLIFVFLKEYKFRFSIRKRKIENGLFEYEFFFKIFSEVRLEILEKK